MTTAPDDLLSAAIALAARGFSVIPLAGKAPAVRTWKMNQTVRVTDDAGLRAWFTRDDVTGIGIVLGRVSGDLIVRDFDDAETYRRWADAHPDLAGTLPSVKTARGFHVYARAVGVKNRVFPDDGELRGEGLYVAAPASLHPSGMRYTWAVPLPAGDVPTVDPERAGFARSYIAETFCATERTERTERAERTERTERTEKTEKAEKAENSGNDGRVEARAHPIPCIELSDSQNALSLCRAEDELSGLVERAIDATLPSAHGQRHKSLFNFARRLKAIPEIAPRPFPELKPIVRRWFDRARVSIQTQDFDTTWGEFVTAWGRIRWAAGEGPLDGALLRAATADPPACAGQYENPGMRLLVSVTRELQRAAGDAPFFLSGRKAGELVGVHSGTASIWLAALAADGVVKIAERPARGPPRNAIQVHRRLDLHWCKGGGTLGTWQA